MSQQPGRDEYTVGWVCALPVELVAARSLLDKRYDAPDLEAGEKWDDTYYMGSIAGHNVVIACLPWRTGTTPAAALAIRMQARFRGIRLRLMVGIGGGVPSHQADIRLGDVVVSVPQHTFGGVVQYDMGKTTPTDVIRIGNLAPPPHNLLSAAVALQSDTLMGESKLLSILSETERIPCLRRCGSSDVLYDAGYDHENGTTCAKCLPEKQVVRPQRLEGQEVVVHHGTIASGNQVMKSAAARDKISQRLGGVLCFEMEAAGLMNDFPCIVIRGISDYADSHKNDHWQGYAASTASAYAKELLLKIPPAQVTQISKVDSTMGEARKRNAQSPETHSVDSKRRRVGNIDSLARRSKEDTSIVLQDRTRKLANEDQTHQFPKGYQARQPLNKKQQQQLLESLKFDQIDERKNTIKRAYTTTCKWLLNSTSYRNWLDATKIQEHHGFLWIKGKAGAGKSTLMKFALEKVCKRESGNLVLSFFFNARGSQLEKSAIGTYRSLLLQLLLAFPTLQDVFETLYTPTSSFDPNRNWSVGSLKALLEEAIQRLENVAVVCFIDALDECDETQIRDMVQFFEHIGDLSIERGIQFSVCFSSRHYPHITIRNGLELVLEGQEGHNQDIINYIETELKIGTSKKEQQIRATVQEKAAGIFMWVVLVVGILNKESDRGRVDQLQQKLREIPGDLHDLFRDILTRDSHNKEELILCIQWVLFAKQSLSPGQLYYAILSGVEPDAVSAWDPAEIDQESMKRFILDCSKGLTDITASQNPKVQFIHESIRDFLLKEGLSTIWPEYKENFTGQSHERLKQCCSAYLEIDLEKSLDISEGRPTALSPKAQELRSVAGQLFPLLEYAVHSIFYHSDLAEGHGISQAQFVNDFQRELRPWVRLHNVFEYRKYREDTSLLYVLAELDCANLIRSHLPLENCAKVEDGRYGCPLLAACALGNNAAIQALSLAFVPASIGRHADYDQAQRGTINIPIQQPSPDFSYSRSVSLLCNAAHVSSEWLLVRLLSSSRCMSDTSASDFQYVLAIVSKRGFTTIVEMLLRDRTFSCDDGRYWKGRSLLLAAENGHESVVKLLVLKGADIGFKYMGYNSVHKASVRGFEKITTFLLDERPDLIESRNAHDKTSLSLAVVNRHTSLAAKLILKGADIHATGVSPDAIVNIASRMGFKDVLILLLDRGADINGQVGDRENPLQVACRKGHKDIVELLLQRGADVNMRSSQFGSALQVACCKTYQSIVELLLERGAYINAQGGIYGNALQAACASGDRGIVELLIEQGADIKSQGGRYGNALQAACRSGIKYIVELILDKGLDVNAQGGKYGNALQAASYIGSADIVELLLRRGANVNAYGGFHGTALAATKDPRVVELLKSYGATLPV